MEDLIASVGSLSLKALPANHATATQSRPATLETQPVQKICSVSESAPAPSVFYFTASSTSEESFRPRFRAKIHSYRKVYVKAKKLALKSTSASQKHLGQIQKIPDSSILQDSLSSAQKIHGLVRRRNMKRARSISLKAPFPTLLNLELPYFSANIQDPSHSCTWEKEFAHNVDIMPEAPTSTRNRSKLKIISKRVISPVTTPSIRRSRIRLRVPRPGGRTGRGGICQLKRIPPLIDWSLMGMEESIGYMDTPNLTLEVDVSGKKGNLLNLRESLECSWIKSAPIRIDKAEISHIDRKRKSTSPHHIPGRCILDPREFALLEKKLCGGHKSKKLRNGRGLAARTASKQVVFDILSNTYSGTVWSWRYQSSGFRAIDFMKGPFKNLLPRTLKTFTCFGKLPAELQIMIWRLAIPARRLLELRLDGAKDNRSAVSSRIHPLLNKRNMAWTMEEFLHLRIQWLAEVDGHLKNGRIVRPITALTNFELKTNLPWTMDQFTYHNFVWTNTCRMPQQPFSSRMTPEITLPFDPVSALLQTCAQSRAAVGLSRQQAFERPDGSVHYCDFDNDAVYLHGSWQSNIGNYARQSREVRSLPRQPRLCINWESDLAKIRHLVINGRILAQILRYGTQPKITPRDLPIIFPNLERITLEYWDQSKILPKVWRTPKNYFLSQTDVSYKLRECMDIARKGASDSSWKPIVELREISSVEPAFYYRIKDKNEDEESPPRHSWVQGFRELYAEESVSRLGQSYNLNGEEDIDSFLSMADRLQAEE